MRRALIAFSLIAALPAAARAQSLFSTHGLGVPMEGVDARGRALGVNGVGLLGLSTSLLNPAEAGGMLRRGVTATLQPWAASVELNGEKGDIGGTRFPLIAVLYPVSRITFTLGYSGLLDQSWAIFAEGKQLLGTDSIETLDLVESVGGIGELKFGAAYFVNEHWSVGASIGLNTGSVNRNVTRQFPDTTLQLRPFETRSSWDYSGPLAAIGVRWDPNANVRAGASVTWSGTLDAKPKEGSTTPHSYDMPLRLAAGVSARVSARLLLTASTTISNYDGASSFVAPGTNDATIGDRALQFGGGIEWSELRSGNRIFPLRLGFRMAKLPFHNQDEARATEWTASGGIGLRLVEDDFGPLAVADLGFERGKRDGWASAATGDGLSENFWRFTASVSLFGR
jgi:hypothetical protein